MIREYRKYLEPKYGKPAPYTIIDQPQAMDIEHPAVSRNRIETETTAQLTREWSCRCCYPAMMNIETENTAFEREGARIPLRVYHPPQPRKGAPVLIFYHGGGWAMNNADVYDTVYRALASIENLTVVAPDYRLAPEHMFPVGLEDAFAALKWTAANATGFGGNPDNIFVCGDSSGGNFAAAIALLSRDRNCPKLRGQVLIYPVTIFNPASKLKSEELYGTGCFLEYDSGAKPMAFMFADYAQSDSPYASPLCAQSLSDLPPALFLSAECDPLLDQALMYAARLEDEGVPVEYKLHEGMIHAYINRPYQETFDSLRSIGRFVSENGL